MLRLVTLFGALALAIAVPPYSTYVTDLEPDVAAKYISEPPFSAPQLATRTAVLPLVRYDDARFRSAEAGPTLGHYWRNGKEIENPNDYVEHVYNARQYHGQDGLGAYAYGYETPESSKVEAKQRSGDVQGAYTYKAGSSNDLIEVRYWADSQGFHQEDNIPKYVPKPVEEAPEVKAARLAHEKAWKEAAYANLHPGAAAANAAANQGVPQNNYNYQNYNPGYNIQGSASGQFGAYSLPPSQLRVRRQTLGQPQYQGQYNQYQNKYQNEYQNQYQGQDYSTTTTTTTTPSPDPTGPPRGFFYGFDYPVSIIVPKNELPENAANPGFPYDHETSVYDAKKK